MPKKPQTKRRQVAGKTNLASYVPFLVSLSEKYPKRGPIIMGGHAVNHWIGEYRERFEDPAAYRTLLGKDLDCLIHPDVVATEFMDDKERYYQPAIFFTDLLFLSARRFFLRQRFTPFSRTFISRLGKVDVPLPGSRKMIQVDFFAHTVGYHPDYVRKRAVSVQLGDDGHLVQIMDPVQCLWQFIVNAAYLHQTRGDSGPRRRTDHYRVLLLGPVVREYLKDLAANRNREAGDDPKDTLEKAVDDLARFLGRPEALAIGSQLGIDWSLILPDCSPFTIEKGAKGEAIPELKRLHGVLATQAKSSGGKRLMPVKSPTPGSLAKLPRDLLLKEDASKGN